MKKKTLLRMKIKFTNHLDIPVELSKFSPDVVLENLTIKFNNCLNGEDIPSDYKTPYIISIYKKVSIYDCTNLTGVL